MDDFHGQILSPGCSRWALEPGASRTPAAPWQRLLTSTKQGPVSVIITWEDWIPSWETPGFHGIPARRDFSKPLRRETQQGILGKLNSIILKGRLNDLSWWTTRVSDWCNPLMAYPNDHRSGQRFGHSWANIIIQHHFVHIPNWYTQIIVA